MVKININNIKTYNDKLSFVLRGKQRLRVVKALEGRKTPTQLKKLTKLSLNNISDILRLLVKVDIVLCLNEKNVTGRIYQLTKTGEKIRKEII